MAATAAGRQLAELGKGKVGFGSHT
jgi:hypothetical protein